MRLTSLLESRFLRFLLAGGIAALVNLVSRYLLSTTLSFRWAVLLAYLIGMAVAWVLMRLFVFDASQRHWGSELARFTIVNVVSASLVWTVSVTLAEIAFPDWGYHFHPLETAHFIGVLLPAITSYIGHKHFSFAKSP